jgi:hypothetical protein
VGQQQEGRRKRQGEEKEKEGDDTDHEPHHPHLLLCVKLAPGACLTAGLRIFTALHLPIHCPLTLPRRCMYILPALVHCVSLLRLPISSLPIALPVI